MLEHWRGGLRDAGRSLTDLRWTQRAVPEDGLMVFDANDPHRRADRGPDLGTDLGTDRGADQSPVKA